MPFADIPGHRAVIALLLRSIRQDSLPPTMLFAGPDGSGKRAMAIAVAQALNCIGPGFGIRPSTGSGRAELVEGRDSGFDACGTCAACLKIARGVHPDVLVIGPGDSGAIKIEQVREVVERAAYRPFEGRRRVVIVDQADALVPAAQNALLKTLEEPPPSSVFIVVTSRPDVLLPTVRSRCIQLTFAAGAQLEIDEDAREVAAGVLAKASTGSEPSRRLDGAKDLLGNGDRDRVVANLRAMASLLRDMEVVTTGADARVLANGDVKSEVERLAPAYKGTRGVDAFAAVDRALEALERNAGVKVVADWLVLQL